MDEDGKRPWKQRFELKSARKRTSKSIKKQVRKVEGATTRHAKRFLVNRWDKIREIRLHIILWLGGVGILIALVGLQMVWFQRGYITDGAVSGGTYAEAARGPVETLDPLFATTPAELSATHLLFSSLYANDDSGHLRGDIATSMTDANDKVFTVKLRHDAKWQDGHPLNADDIIFTVGLMKNPSVRSVMLASWQGITVSKSDNYTVQFTLPAAYSAFPQALTFGILPEHLLNSVDPSSLRESTYSTAPVGSGPFSLRLVQNIDKANGRKIIHMDANRAYYAGAPRLDRFQLHVYNDDESMARALRTGEVNAASDVSTNVARTVDTHRYDAVIRPVNSGVYALFNLNEPVLKDKAVRQALLLATNTNIIRDHLYGNPQKLYLPFVHDQVDGLSAISAPMANKKAAEDLLNANGWVLKNGVRMKGQDRLRLRIVTRQNNDYETVLQLLAGQWRQLGVEVDTQVVGASDFTQDVLQFRNYDVLLDELVIGGDPDVFAYWHSRGLLNFTGYNNGTADDALSSARTTSDQTLRSVKYVAFARQWLDDIPAIGLYQSNFIYLHTKSTHAVDPTETIVSPDDHYANVRYWTAETGKVYKTP
jgi:peptide/nickel transport system substrate-binding protein